MTYNEAVQSMKEGNKVTHRHFTSDEFFKWNGHNIECENGYDMTKWYRGDEWQNNGWRILS